MSKLCAIDTCRAQLLGMNYYGVVLNATPTDRERTIAVCPGCMRKINRVRKTA